MALLCLHCWYVDFHYFALHMSDLRLKLKIIFLPYLLIFLSVLVLMVSAKWYFEVKHRAMLFHGFTFDVGVSAVLSIVLVLVVLRKRFQILDVKDKYGKQDHGFHNVITIPCIVVPVCFALNYVGAEGYELIHVKSIDEIHKHEKHSRYYAIDKFRLDTTMPYVKFDRYTSGKHNRTLNFTCAFVFPVLPEANATIENTVWYGERLEKRMSNREDNSVKEAVEMQFVADCNRYIANAPTHMGSPVYFENLPDCSERKALIRTILTVPDEKYEEVLLLQPRYEPFEERATQDGERFVIALSFSLFVFFLTLAFSPIHEKNLKLYLNNQLPDKDDIMEAVAYLQKHRFHPLAIMLMIFIITMAVVLIRWLC